MEMRIVVPTAGNCGALADRLAAAYGTERISFSGDRPEIEVHVAGESDRTVIGVLESVERWLDQAGLASAEMWLGEHLYRLARWAPAGQTRLHAGARPRAGASTVLPRPVRVRRPTSRRRPRVLAS